MHTARYTTKLNRFEGTSRKMSPKIHIFLFLIQQSRCRVLARLLLQPSLSLQLHPRRSSPSSHGSAGESNEFKPSIIRDAGRAAETLPVGTRKAGAGAVSPWFCLARYRSRVARTRAPTRTDKGGRLYTTTWNNHSGAVTVKLTNFSR